MIYARPYSVYLRGTVTLEVIRGLGFRAWDEIDDRTTPGKG